MPLNQYDVSVINTAIGALPSILALIKGFHASTSPADPLPTDAQALTALLTACAQSVTVDEAWKAAHPEAVPGPLSTVAPTL